MTKENIPNGSMYKYASYVYRKVGLKYSATLYMPGGMEERFANGRSARMAALATAPVAPAIIATTNDDSGAVELI